MALVSRFRGKGKKDLAVKMRKKKCFHLIAVLP
jgi:hypothetical protein